MDKILYRNPSKSEVIGRCGGDEKNKWPGRTDKSQTLFFEQIFTLVSNNTKRVCMNPLVSYSW